MPSSRPRLRLARALVLGAAFTVVGAGLFHPSGFGVRSQDITERECSAPLLDRFAQAAEREFKKWLGWARQQGERFFTWWDWSVLLLKRLARSAARLMNL